jgi:hypothetical protein
MWYCRHEIQFRQALFFSAASVAGAFSGLLAFGIAKMDGVGGLEGWRWIFILEGIATVLTSVVAFFALHDFPETASFLTEEERAFVVFRLKYQSQRPVKGQEEEAGQTRVAEAGEFKWAYVWSAFKDWQIWVNIFVYWGVSCSDLKHGEGVLTSYTDRVPSLRHQPLSSDHYSQPRLHLEQVSAPDYSDLHHRCYSRCHHRMDFGSGWKEEPVHRGLLVHHDCRLFDVGFLTIF